VKTVTVERHHPKGIFDPYGELKHCEECDARVAYYECTEDETEAGLDLCQECLAERNREGPPPGHWPGGPNGWWGYTGD
jgi:hypothetical protein